MIIHNIYSFVYPYGYLPIKYFTNIKNDDLFNDELREYDPFFISFNKKNQNTKLHWKNSKIFRRWN